MAIPKFERDGLLPEGIHQCNGAEFIEVFCAGKHREQFRSVFQDVLDFSASRGAIGVLVGGSFVTKVKQQPRDLDCVIIFENENQIPDRTERLELEGTRLDVFFCAKTQNRILASFIRMFSRTKDGRSVGVLHVGLVDGAGRRLWELVKDVDEDTLEIVKRIYINRHIVDRNNSRKALITVHGIRSHGEWNAEVAHIASSNGWIFAPFTYGYFELKQLAKLKDRNQIVDRFRDHIGDIFDRYHCNISVIGHSFGTYVVVKYLMGFDLPPVSIDTLILTGSIVNEDFDLDRLRGRASVVLNEVAPNDEVVGWARSATLWRDDLIGQSGVVGFKKQSDRLEQRSCEIFDHNNVIRRDVVTQRWMPFLESGIGSGRREAAIVFAETLKRNKR